MTGEPIAWTGDLDDDCVAHWRGMTAHAELMGKGMRPEDPEFDPANDSTTDYWFAAVYRGQEVLMHSGETLAGHVQLTSGYGARLVCELWMRAEAATAQSVK